MRCPVCGASARYIPDAGIMIGRGHIVCDKGHVTKAYHLAVGMEGARIKVAVFLNKEDLEKAIDEAGSKELKQYYKYIKYIYGL